MNLSRDDRQRRYEQLPRQIQIISHSNPAVYRIAQEFASGRICFLDEALAQMILMLATDWKETQRQAFNVMMVALSVDNKAT